MSARIVTATTTAYITDGCELGPRDFVEGKPAAVIDGLVFSVRDMTLYWTKVGEAEITVAINDPGELIANRVATLKAQLQQHRANAQVKENAILEQISTLLAITFNPDGESS